MATATDRAAQQRWEKENAQAPLRPQPPTTVSGVPVEALCTLEQLGDFDPEVDLGYPGQYPFVRGVHASMYRSRLWTMRQFAGFGTARQTNERFKFLLDKGQTGLSTAFDLPTLMGLDSDDPRSLGEVGRLGVTVDTLDDMRDLFDGIDLAKVSVSMTINAPALVVMAFFLANARDRGIPWSELRGTTQNDIFEEIAKYRAARVIWADAMRNRYGARKEASWKLRFHAQTAGCALQAQQPEVNLIRVAYQALAAVLGGCQSLHTNSMDETLALPSEHAVTLALRTQQVLAYETGVTNTVDPLGGSYFVEALTKQMQGQARDYIRRIEELGGMIPALESGFFRREIADAAFAYQRDVDAKRKLIVGVNAFQEAEEKPIDILQIGDAVEKE